MSQQTNHVYEFGPFQLVPEERLLFCNGGIVALSPKDMDLLLVLVESRGRLLQKDELMKHLWPESFVEEANLSHHVSLLRKALGDHGGGVVYIETVPKHGYRFVVPVREVREDEDLGTVPWRQSSSPSGGPAENLSQIPDRLTSGAESDAENRSLGGSGLIAETEALKRRRLPTHFWIICFLVLLSAAGLGWWLARKGTRTAEVAPVLVPLTSHLGVEAHPSFSPDGSQVAFSWNGEKQDNFDIYVKLIGSGAQLRLTQALEADSNPAWSPDGASIAFIRGGSSGKASVFLTSPLGPPERRVALISPIVDPKPWASQSGLAWSPDGRSLVCGDRNSDHEPPGLVLLSVETGEKLRLTSPEKMSFDDQPAFSPDGRTLAFVRSVRAGVRDIYLLPLSKDFRPPGEPRRLTFENRLVFSPAWTLDGQQIIFSSGPFLSPNLFRVAASGSGKPQRLATVGEGGSEVAISHRTRRLVYTRESTDWNIWRLETSDFSQKKTGAPTRLIASTYLDFLPEFSPDGKKIAFNSNRTGDFQIWICDSDGSNPQQLTSRGVACGFPHWSPDGQQIAFESGSAGASFQIYIISINGGKLKPLTSGLANNGHPNWSRDGKWIYFSSDRSGDWQIWKVPASGGDAVWVTRNGGVGASESPDSQWVYYSKNAPAPSLWRVPKNGGEESQVLESIGWLAFVIAREGIYFAPGVKSTGPYSIRFLDFSTEKVRTVLEGERKIHGFLSASRDGKQILYTQIDQEGTDLMLVENFR